MRYWVFKKSRVNCIAIQHIDPALKTTILYTYKKIFIIIPSKVFRFVLNLPVPGFSLKTIVVADYHQKFSQKISHIQVHFCVHYLDKYKNKHSNNKISNTLNMQKSGFLLQVVNFMPISWVYQKKILFHDFFTSCWLKPWFNIYLSLKIISKCKISTQ